MVFLLSWNVFRRSNDGQHGTVGARHPYTIAEMPVMARPAMSVLISYEPS